MVISDYIIPFLIELVGSSFIQEATFLWSLQDEICSLRLKAQYLSSFLRDLDAKTSNRITRDELLRTHTKEITSLAQQIEQIIDRYRMVVGRGSVLQRCICSPRTLPEIHQIRLQIDRVQRRLQEAIGTMNEIGAAAGNLSEEDHDSSGLRSKL